MERLCLALCHPPLIKKSRLWLCFSLSSFYNDIIMCLCFCFVFFCFKSRLLWLFNRCPFPFSGWTPKQQAWIHTLVSGICPRAAFRHHRREAVPLPGVSPSISHQQPCQVSRSSFFSTSQAAARTWGIRDSFTESKTKGPIWVLRGMFKLFITLLVKVCCKETPAWENYKYTQQM